MRAMMRCQQAGGGGGGATHCACRARAPRAVFRIHCARAVNSVSHVPSCADASARAANSAPKRSSVVVLFCVLCARWRSRETLSVLCWLYLQRRESPPAELSAPQNESISPMARPVIAALALLPIFYLQLAERQQRPRKYKSEKGARPSAAQKKKDLQCTTATAARIRKRFTRYAATRSALPPLHTCTLFTTWC